MTSVNSGVFIGATLSSGIEFLEIVAIAYALSSTGFRREALLGSIAGIFGVAVAGALLGPELVLFPLRWLQVAAGMVLIYFGSKWTKKSIVRQAAGKRAGWIDNPLRNKPLETNPSKAGFSYLNFVVMTKCAALETFEVALIVITIGLGSRAWLESAQRRFHRSRDNDWTSHFSARLFAAIARCIHQAGRRTYAAHLGNVLVVRRPGPQMAIRRVVGNTALLSLFASVWSRFWWFVDEVLSDSGMEPWSAASLARPW